MFSFLNCYKNGSEDEYLSFYYCHPKTPADKSPLPLYWGAKLVSCGLKEGYEICLGKLGTKTRKHPFFFFPPLCKWTPLWLNCSLFLFFWSSQQSTLSENEWPNHRTIDALDVYYSRLAQVNFSLYCSSALARRIINTKHYSQYDSIEYLNLFNASGSNGKEVILNIFPT